MNRLFGALALVVASVILLASCGNEPAETSSGVSSQSTSANKTLTLPFSYADTFNPYTAKTKANRELSRLMYESLFYLNENSQPINLLADTVSVSKFDCTVTIKAAKFTDGTAVTAGDIVYSANLARAEGSCYAEQLAPLVSCTAVNGNTVKFTFSICDDYITALLDFPIIKSNTHDMKDANNQSVPPIGCGPYIFESESGHYSLAVNENYYRGAVGTGNIELLNLPDDESLEHYLTSGRISLYYSDMSDGRTPKTYGKYRNVQLTNLIYLGVNCKSGPTADASMRLAISAAIDRTLVCEQSFFGYAEPSSGLFPAARSDIVSELYGDNTANYKQAVAYLEQMDYNKRDDDGYLTDKSGNRLSIRILYNSSNSTRKKLAEQLVSQLKEVGIYASTVGKDSKGFADAVSSGSYDIYIGEIKLNKNYDVSSLFTAELIGGGLPEASETAAAFTGYYAGEGMMITAYTAFCSEMPIIPLCFRCGVLTMSQNISSDIAFSLSDPYIGIRTVKR